MQVKNLIITFCFDIKPNIFILIFIPNCSGTKIVFITNQNGISKGHITENDFKGKMEAIIKRLNVPIQVSIILRELFDFL